MEVFFPKLDEPQMLSFPEIAISLLKEYGWAPFECGSAEEALSRAAALKDGDTEYPVHFTPVDTSGEKEYEEFYTHEETVDLTRYAGLGVVTNIKPKDKRDIDSLLSRLESALSNRDAGKDEIVGILQNYLPNFTHEEKHHFLDEKM